MIWHVSHKFDKAALPLADRHYNRQKPGSPQFVAPGKSLVLITECRRALWVSRMQLDHICKHDWPGSWECALFRNEGAGLSSELIRQAVAATRWSWGDPPDAGFITFVDRSKTRSKKNPGYCYQMAGWSVVGKTKVNKLTVLHLPKEDIEDRDAPMGTSLRLFGAP